MVEKRQYKSSTLGVRAGQEPDPVTGACAVPDRSDIPTARGHGLPEGPSLFPWPHASAGCFSPRPPSAPTAGTDRKSVV